MVRGARKIPILPRRKPGLAHVRLAVGVALAALASNANAGKAEPQPSVCVRSITPFEALHVDLDTVKLAKNESEFLLLGGSVFNFPKRHEHFGMASDTKKIAFYSFENLPGKPIAIPRPDTKYLEMIGGKVAKSEVTGKSVGVLTDSAGDLTLISLSDLRIAEVPDTRNLFPTLQQKNKDETFVEKLVTADGKEFTIQTEYHEGLKDDGEAFAPDPDVQTKVVSASPIEKPFETDFDATTQALLYEHTHEHVRLLETRSSEFRSREHFLRKGGLIARSRRTGKKIGYLPTTGEFYSLSNFRLRSHADTRFFGGDNSPILSTLFFTHGPDTFSDIFDLAGPAVYHGKMHSVLHVHTEHHYDAGIEAFEDVKTTIYGKKKLPSTRQILDLPELFSP